jgi:hypothetical protein
LWCQSGLSFGKPEQEMGLRAVPTTSAHYDDAYIPADRRVGTDGQGLQIAFSALDSGRLASPQSPLAWPGGLLCPGVSGFQQEDHRPSGTPALVSVNGGPIALTHPIGYPARESHCT